MNSSTDFAIIQLLDKIYRPTLKKKEHIIAVYMDLSKAFDTIDHRTLLYKLENYGVRGIALSWLKSYLSNGQQFVFIDGSKGAFMLNFWGQNQRFQTWLEQNAVASMLIFE